MNVLFISRELYAASLVPVLAKEGCDVKLYIADKGRRNNLIGIAIQTTDWRNELDWVGKDGLIIFDDVTFSEEQEELRESGYNVVGGSKTGDKFELDREYGNKIFERYGVQTAPLFDFDSIQDAINHVKSRPDTYVVKQNNHNSSKKINYVGHFSDGRDVIDVLTSYQNDSLLKNEKVSLQKKVTGVEIGVGRYFNGNDWVGPIEINLEHVKLFPGNVGPMTSEMGTLMWYTDNEKNKLYNETLVKLKPFLQKIDFRGDFEINCIVNENGAFALEPTCRFGSPAIHAQIEIHESPWSEFLMAVATGTDYQLQYKSGYAIVALLTAPPFPYIDDVKEGSFPAGNTVYFDKLSEEEFKHVHLEQVSKDKTGRYYVSDTWGYICYITGVTKNVNKTREMVNGIAEKIYTPKAFWRHDIGLDFETHQKEKLVRWGYEVE